MFHVAAFGRNQNEFGKRVVDCVRVVVLKQRTQPQGQPMNKFLQRFGSKVIGHLSGFDRMMFRGSIQRLCYPAGVLLYLYWLKVLFKDFAVFAKDTTSTLCNAIEHQALERDTPMIYLASTAESKEERALAEAAKHQRTSGLIAVMGCVEPCRTVVMRRGEDRRLQPRIEDRKCLHYYHYYLDAKFGLMYTRLQSWFPFTMYIGINGREWLAKQMKQANLDYVKVDNCFTYIEDFDQAQALLDAQVHADWPRLLEQLTARDHPLHGKLLPGHNPYYWSLQVSEWATDILFRSKEDLAELYPLFVHHAIETMHCGDVMRFLGYKVPATGRVRNNFKGEVLIDMKRREEGTRVKFQVKTNSGKIYDKHGNLRLEGTVNNPQEFTCQRTAPGDEEGELSPHRMRKGVVDIVPRAQVCQEINDRFANFLAAAADTEPVGKLVEAITAPVQWRGRRARGLNPLAACDVKLLEIVARGDFLIHGFRNRDVREALYGTAPVAIETKRRQSAAVTRQLRLLQAHDLIRKEDRSHRYHLTDKGQRTITAILAVRRTDIAKLMETAA
jgi:hypothetical protein